MRIVARASVRNHVTGYTICRDPDDTWVMYDVDGGPLRNCPPKAIPKERGTEMPARVMKEFQAPRGLPRKTASVCPECIKVIPAVVREKEGRVIMEKTCRVHGYFWDIISNDVDFYLRMEVYAHDGVGYENPYYDKFKSCPTNCGMCSHHKSHTGLALMDLTNRCNLKCPVCFANANAAGYVYEPTREQIHFMLKTLREQQ